jgi:GT2 family glycosyltransferase
MTPRVTAIVLNYDGRELLEVILPSLRAQEYEHFETVVLDNGSSDGSVAYLREHWPQVRVISAGPVNIGVSAALNLAVRSARSELIALLNNDIELEPRWLGELVAALERHPEAATVAGKLLSFHRRGEIDSAGDLFTRAATAFGRGAGEPDIGAYDLEEEVFAPTAGAALYRASAFDRVGPFDEAFWAYFEDVDWDCERSSPGCAAGMCRARAAITWAVALRAPPSTTATTSSSSATRSRCSSRTCPRASRCATSTGSSATTCSRSHTALARGCCAPTCAASPRRCA